MSSTVDKTCELLMSQLKRLDALVVAKGEQMQESVERIKAECERAKAVNETARNIIGLGDLHLRSEMLQMSRPDRPFKPGEMFADRIDVNAPQLGQTGEAKRKALVGWGDGSSTRVNELGEFED